MNVMKMSQGRKEVFAVTTGDEPQQICLYPIVVVDNASCELRHLRIYANGRIECKGNSYTIESLGQQLDAGYIQTSLRDEEYLHIPELAGVNVTNVINIVEESELLKEIEDIIRELRGEPTTVDKCLAAYDEYRSNPTAENRSIYPRSPDLADARPRGRYGLGHALLFLSPQYRQFSQRLRKKHRCRLTADEKRRSHHPEPVSKRFVRCKIGAFHAMDH